MTSVPPQQRFFTFFQHEITSIQEQIERLTTLPSAGPIAGERSDAADHCLASISRLSSEVNEAASYLPAYDQRTYAAAIKALHEKLQDAKASFAPKPKFSFSSRARVRKGSTQAAPDEDRDRSHSPSAISLSDAAELAAQKRSKALAAAAAVGGGAAAANTPTLTTTTTTTTTTTSSINNTPNPASPRSTTPPPPLLVNVDKSGSRGKNDNGSQPSSPQPRLSTTSTSITISHQKLAHLILPAATSSASASPPPPCTLSHLTSCVINLLPSSSSSSPSSGPTPSFPPSLTLTHTKTSLLLLGHVAGPTHITDVSQSTIVLSTHQVRIHHSHNVHVYLHCTSRPIIEHCTGIVFSPLPRSLHSLFSAAPAETPSSERPTPNLWNQVDDFQWLKPAAGSSSSNSPSPNWSLDPSTHALESIWPSLVNDTTTGSNSSTAAAAAAPTWSVRDILAAAGILPPLSPTTTTTTATSTKS